MKLEEYNFNTEYKVGDRLHCKEDVFYNSELLFKKGNNYRMDNIDYSTIGYDTYTSYQPCYFVSNGEKNYNFRSEENFTISEGSSGGSGFSGYGKMDEHFCNLKELRQKKLMKFLC